MLVNVTLYKTAVGVCKVILSLYLISLKKVFFQLIFQWKNNIKREKFCCNQYVGCIREPNQNLNGKKSAIFFSILYAEAVISTFEIMYFLGTYLSITKRNSNRHSELSIPVE